MTLPSRERITPHDLWWPVLGMIVMVIGGMLVTTIYAPALGLAHPGYWGPPGDIWSTVLDSINIYNGQLRDLYVGNGLVTFPGIAFLFLPIIWAQESFRLGLNTPELIPHPSFWLVLGPYELFLGSIVLIPLYQWAIELGVKRSIAALLVFIQAGFLAQVLVLWGHPEDSIAVAFALWGLLCLCHSRETRGAWLWGVAIAFQPLVLLPLLLWFVLVPVRRWWRSIWRMASISLLMLATPLFRHPHATLRSIVEQPQQVFHNHITPWLPTAPILKRNIIIKQLIPQHVDGRFVMRVSRIMVGNAVSAGPVRMIAILLACITAVWLYRYHRRHPLAPADWLWISGILLYLRVFTEPILVPYYTWSATALLVLAVAITRPRSLWWVTLIQAASIVWSYHDAGAWLYWVPIQVVFLFTIWAGRPRAMNTPIVVPQDDSVSLTSLR